MRSYLKENVLAPVYKTEIIICDFNARHQHSGSGLACPKCRDFYNDMQENKLEMLSMGETTNWARDINRIPDLPNFYT
jgi:hypothetical protein